MGKRIFAAVLVALVLSALSARSAFAVTEISTAAEFIAIADDTEGEYKLTADIDLTGSGFVSIPEFNGRFDGAGHTIRGVGAKPLIITNRGELASFTLDGRTSAGANTTFKSNSRGCLCDFSYGGKFSDIVVAGYSIACNKATNGYGMGLFAGIVYTGSEFRRCATDASAKAVKGSDHSDDAAFTGHIVITNTVGVGVCFVDCTNNVSISTSGVYGNTNPCSGGFTAYVSAKGSGNIPEIQFIRCINRGNLVVINGNRSAGGFIGKGTICDSDSQDRPMLLRFVQCINYGSVTGTVGYAVGGFVGWTGNLTQVRFESCLNAGDVGGTSASYAGGYIGQIIGERTSSSILGDNYLNSVNTGNVSGKIAGGFFGRICAKYSACRAYANIYNCANYGTVTGTTEAGTLFANEGTGGGGTILLDNDWIAAEPVYSNATHTVTMTNLHTNDTDVAALNEIATATEGYMPWVLGASGKPELAWYATTCDESAIPVVFCDWSGKVLKKEFVEKGGDATPPKVARHDGLTCVGWSAPYNNVQSITICNAVYRAVGLRISIR